MSGPLLKAIANGSKYDAVVLEIASNGQVTGGGLVGTGVSRMDLNFKYSHAAAVFYRRSDYSRRRIVVGNMQRAVRPPSERPHHRRRRQQIRARGGRRRRRKRSARDFARF